MLKEYWKKSEIRNDSKQTNGPQSCGAPTPYTDREERGESGAQNISSLDAVKRTQVDVVPVQTWAWQGSLLNVWLEVQRHVVFILWHFRLPVFLLWHCATVLRMAYPRRGGSVTTTIHYSIYCMLSAFRLPRAGSTGAKWMKTRRKCKNYIWIFCHRWAQTI